MSVHFDNVNSLLAGQYLTTVIRFLDFSSIYIALAYLAKRALGELAICFCEGQLKML